MAQQHQLMEQQHQLMEQQHQLMEQQQKNFELSRRVEALEKILQERAQKTKLTVLELFSPLLGAFPEKHREKAKSILEDSPLDPEKIIEIGKAHCEAWKSGQFPSSPDPHDMSRNCDVNATIYGIIFDKAVRRYTELGFDELFWLGTALLLTEYGVETKFDATVPVRVSASLKKEKAQELRQKCGVKGLSPTRDLIKEIRQLHALITLLLMSYICENPEISWSPSSLIPNPVNDSFTIHHAYSLPVVFRNINCLIAFCMLICNQVKKSPTSDQVKKEHNVRSYLERTGGSYYYTIIMYTLGFFPGADQENLYPSEKTKGLWQYLGRYMDQDDAKTELLYAIDSKVYKIKRKKLYGLYSW